MRFEVAGFVAAGNSINRERDRVNEVRVKLPTLSNGWARSPSDTALLLSTYVTILILTTNRRVPEIRGRHRLPLARNLILSGNGLSTLVPHTVCLKQR